MEDRNMKSGFILGLGLLGAAAFGHAASLRANAAPVGETHRVATERTASLRDARHRPELRITIWYPAARDAVESPVVIGPANRVLFEVGAAAAEAPFVEDGARHPVILLSHGFGGSARMMGWFGIALAGRGYIVVAVDHPGNNALDQMTLSGTVLWWDRAEDLRSALDAVGRDPAISRRADLSHVGVAGFSDGGFTTLVTAGAKVVPSRWIEFCHDNPVDGDCQPNQEFAVTSEDRAKVLAMPELAAEVAHAGEDHAIPQLRAAFAMAPALVQALDPAGLSRLRAPVYIMLGDADTVAPPATSGLAAGAAIPNARVDLLPGASHYDFLSMCTDVARAIIPACESARAQAETHRRAIAAAEAFFGRYLSGSQ
jgi:predicted dienelactone hydrolase